MDSDEIGLPLVGSEVVRCCVDTAFSMDLRGDRGYAEIRIEGAFRLETDGWSGDLSFSIERPLFGPALGLFGKTVASATAAPDGGLHLQFSNGASIRVAPSEQYEAWTITAAGGYRVVSLPGGGLATWD